MNVKKNVKFTHKKAKPLGDMPNGFAFLCVNLVCSNQISRLNLLYDVYSMVRVRPIFLALHALYDAG